MGDRMYRVVVEGELGGRFAHAFDGMELVAADGTTVLTGAIADRTQLRGLLNRIDDLGLTVISLDSVDMSTRADFL